MVKSKASLWQSGRRILDDIRYWIYLSDGVVHQDVLGKTKSQKSLMKQVQETRALEPNFGEHFLGFGVVGWQDRLCP